MPTCGFGGGRRRSLAAVALPLLLCAGACTTTAEHRKLERRVVDLQRSGVGASADGRLAEQGAQLDREEMIPDLELVTRHHLLWTIDLLALQVDPVSTAQIADPNTRIVN